MLWYIVLLVFSYVCYKWAILPYFYWKKRGIPHKKPLPIFGNFWPVMSQKRNFLEFQVDAYNMFPNERYFGNFQLTSPTLFIRDVDLIKQIGVKDFDHFMDHRNMGNSDDELFYKNLIALKGQEWREMRAFLSPTFTSSKMKGMFTLMASCADRLIKHYLDMNEKQIELELKDLFSRYANDVIGTCAFGVECDSLKNPANEFFEAGRDVTNFRGFRGLKMLVWNFAPEIARFLKLRMFSGEMSSFFLNLIKETIAYREKNNVIRPDVIHLLLEARKGKLKHENKPDENDRGFAVVEESSLGKEEVRLDGISDVDIASQCFIFYIAGFDTASTVLSFALTELAIQPEIQEKLFQEIFDVMEATNDNLTYEAIMKMKYLDMVISETLRKWPPAPALDRACTKDLVISPVKAGEVPITVKSGELVAIPIIGLHRDPKYFPDPDRFDPERFSDENKDNIVPYSYLPFGVGPRACIGSRFALLESKIIVAKLLYKFEAIVVERTSVPIQLTRTSVKLAPENGFWIGLKRRSHIP